MSEPIKPCQSCKEAVRLISWMRNALMMKSGFQANKVRPHWLKATDGFLREYRRAPLKEKP